MEESWTSEAQSSGLSGLRMDAAHCGGCATGAERNKPTGNVTLFRPLRAASETKHPYRSRSYKPEAHRPRVEANEGEGGGRGSRR